MHSIWKASINVRNFIKTLTVFLTVLGLQSCESDLKDPTIDFVGDSIVARWDINEDFPSYCVYNHGIGGSGIELLNSYRSRFMDNDVVVISGTNDHHYFASDRRNDYAQKYIKAIEALTNKRIYIFSVLPRKFEGDRDHINKDIEAFNMLIKSLVQDIDRITYLDVYNDFMKGSDINYRYYSDGLHPNTIGYEILTQKLLKAL